jgi:hypothetical protein
MIWPELMLLLHLRRRLMFGRDYGSFVLFQKCVCFGGGFFEEFFPIMGPLHGGMSWLIALIVYSKKNMKVCFML